MVLGGALDQGRPWVMLLHVSLSKSKTAIGKGWDGTVEPGFFVGLFSFFCFVFLPSEIVPSWPALVLFQHSLYSGCR